MAARYRCADVHPALLYSRVGHAGAATGYLGVMTLFSFARDSIKSGSLVMHLEVADSGICRFIRVDYFDWKVLVQCKIGVDTGSRNGCGSR